MKRFVILFVAAMFITSCGSVPVGSKMETNLKNKDGAQVRKPIPIESVWQSKLDRPEVFSTYKNHSGSKTSFGNFVVELTIGTDGKIRKGKVIKSELNNADLESSLLEVIKKIRIWPFFANNDQNIIHTYEFSLLSESNRNASPLALKLENVSFKILSKDLMLQKAKNICISDFPERSDIYDKKYSDWKKAHAFAISSSKEVLDEIAHYDSKKADLFSKMNLFAERFIAESYQSERGDNQPRFCEKFVMHLESVAE